LVDVLYWKASGGAKSKLLVKLATSVTITVYCKIKGSEKRWLEGKGMKKKHLLQR